MRGGGYQGASVIRRGWNLGFATVGATAALALGAAPAHGQQQPVPQGALPTQDQITPPTPEPADTPRARVDSRGALEAAPCPFDDSPLRLNLTQVRFARPDGSALQPEIAAALAGIELPTGDQPVRVVCDVRDAANAALRRGGWIASVQVPPQEIAGGELRLNVVTARIVETRVRGDAGPYEELLRRRIAELEGLDPLNERTAERLLLLAGDVPGLDVALTLRPAGTGQGDVVGELTISYRRFQVLGNVQNYNSRLLGRETAYVRAEYFGLTGLGDITYVGGSTTADFEEQRIVQVGHIMNVGASGATVGGRFSYAWSRPDLGPLDFRTDTLIAGFDVTAPITRSLNRNALAAFGFDYVDQKTDIGAGGTLLPLTADKLRILYGRLSGDIRRVRGDGGVAHQLAMSLEVRKGLDVFDASEPGFSGGRLQSRIDGEAEAVVVRATASGLLGLGKYFALAGEAIGQYASDPLLNYEEFAAGNLTIGRGYDPGSNSGDRAAAFRAELQANVPLLPANVQLFGFYDHVHLDNLDVGSIERNRTLRSYGGGVRVALPGSALLEVAYAHPRDRALRIDDEPPPDRLLVSLSFRFRDRAR